MSESDPRPPRRLFLAAALAALVAGGGVGLVATGAVTAPQTEHFQFSRGTTFAGGEDTRLRGFLADAAQDDRLRVVILGHSGTQGDAAANLDLSLARAEAAQAIALDLGIELSRITTSGVGGGDPLPRPPGQSDRAYESTLARVEVTLQVRR